MDVERIYLEMINNRVEAFRKQPHSSLVERRKTHPKRYKGKQNSTHHGSRTMMNTMLFVVCILLGCASRNPMEEAKAVLKSHEEFFKARNLDGVMSNMADDGVALAPRLPLIAGKEVCRQFYTGLFAVGTSQFTHEYQSEEVVGDIAVLCRYAHGSTITRDSTSVPLDNNFLVMLRYHSDGTMKLWRAAFAPRSQ